MKTVIVIVVIFCAISYAASEVIKLPMNIESVVDTVSSSCVFGVKSISMAVYTRDIPYGKNIGVNVPCNDFNSSKPIAILVHGFVTEANYSISYMLTKELIEKNFTVFSLDWSQAACLMAPPGVRLTFYYSAVKNTRQVGQLMAKYVISLIEKCGASLDNMIFIGHSLGAHVCGFASKEIQKSGYGLVSRIFGGDPAGPLFENNKCADRLCNTDAKTTFAFHTTSTLGISKPIGGVDFYFNGGSSQPGCLYLDIICEHFNSMLYLAIAAKCTCKFSGVAMPYPEVTYRIPPYPQNDTTDCFAMDCTIFDNNNGFDKLKGKSYYMFVNSDEFCTQESFSCQG